MYPIRPIVCSLIALSTRQIHHIKPQFCACQTSSTTLQTALAYDLTACRSLRSRAGATGKHVTRRATKALSEKEQKKTRAQALVESYGSYDAETGALNLCGYHHYEDVISENGVADQIPSPKPFSIRDVLAALREYKDSICTIDLSYNMIGITGATEIINFASSNLPRLQELNLQSNRIDPVDYLIDDFVEAAQGLLKKDGFKKLNLLYNNIAYTSSINSLLDSGGYKSVPVKSKKGEKVAWLCKEQMEEAENEQSSDDEK